MQADARVVFASLAARTASAVVFIEFETAVIVVVTAVKVADRFFRIAGVADNITFLAFVYAGFQADIVFTAFRFSRIRAVVVIQTFDAIIIIRVADLTVRAM